MSNFLTFRGLWISTTNFIKNPITEMVCAFIIEMSRNIIFSFLYQLTGATLIHGIIQILIICLPWIMLGHGALRFPQPTNSKYYSDNNTSFNRLKSKQNLILLSIFMVSFILVKLIWH